MGHGLHSGVKVTLILGEMSRHSQKNGSGCEILDGHMGGTCPLPYCKFAQRGEEVERGKKYPLNSV